MQSAAKVENITMGLLLQPTLCFRPADHALGRTLRSQRPALIEQLRVDTQGRGRKVWSRKAISNYLLNNPRTRRSRSQRPPQSKEAIMIGNTALNTGMVTRTLLATAPP